MSVLFGGIEAGGNKFVCAVGAGPDDLRAYVRIATTTPAETIARTVDFFTSQAEASSLIALGIGSFGPVDPLPSSSTFGHITSTPKPGWANIDLRGQIERALHLPVAFDTDVTAAALAEHRWGAAMGLDSLVYVTIGTGIGGGAMVNGSLLHGLIHPEMGHIRIPHDRDADPYGGNCPYHGDCFEGLACGPAIEARWGCSPNDLPSDHKAWHLEARYIAHGMANLICTLSPQRIVMGGGVMRQRHLFPLVRRQIQENLNGYVRAPEILDHIDDFIVPPALGDRSGVLGAIALAQDLVQ